MTQETEVQPETHNLLSAFLYTYISPNFLFPTAPQSCEGCVKVIAGTDTRSLLYLPCTPRVKYVVKLKPDHLLKTVPKATDSEGE